MKHNYLTKSTIAILVFGVITSLCSYSDTSLIKEIGCASAFLGLIITVAAIAKWAITDD